MSKTIEELQDAIDDAAMKPNRVQTTSAMVQMPTLGEMDAHLDKVQARKAKRGIISIARAIPPGTVGPCGRDEDR